MIFFFCCLSGEARFRREALENQSTRTVAGIYVKKAIRVSEMKKTRSLQS